MPLILRIAHKYNNVIPMEKGGAQNEKKTCSHMLEDNRIYKGNDVRYGRTHKVNTDRGARGRDNTCAETLSKIWNTQS